MPEYLYRIQPARTDMLSAGVFNAEVYPFRTALPAQPRPEEGS